jgi:hypothetical protein
MLCSQHLPDTLSVVQHWPDTLSIVHPIPLVLCPGDTPPPPFLYLLHPSLLTLSSHPCSLTAPSPSFHPAPSAYPRP